MAIDEIRGSSARFNTTTRIPKDPDISLKLFRMRKPMQSLFQNGVPIEVHVT